MAEGIVHERANLGGTKFFCHLCLRDVSLLSPELICPECSTGFVEEISSASKNPDNFERIMDFFDMVPLDFIEHNERPLIPDIEESDRLSIPPAESEADSEEFGELSFSPFLHEETAESPYPLPHSFELPDRLYDIRLLGNEYSSDDDVDALASQLLDEVEISGPPPLTKEQIKALPIVTLSQDQESKELQCTVCMSDFKVGDKAKKLTCEHLFHDKCITPWLEKQASCPNCRKTIKVDKNKRSLSCPRTLSFRSRNTNSSDRRFSEVSNLGDFFTASMNPFRFL